MGRLSEFILSCLLNSLWQIPILYGVAALGGYLLRNCSASYRHILWLATLLLFLIAPIVSAAQLLPALQLESSSSSVSTAVSQRMENITTDQVDATPFNHLRRLDSQASLTTTPRQIQFFTIGYLLFLIVAAVRFGRLWVGKEKLRRSVAVELLTPEIESATQQCRLLLNVESARIAHSNLARVPYTLGVTSPMIVLPDSFCSGLDNDTLRSVVAHEMAHVRRSDYLIKLASELVSLPISFHPVTFLIKRRIDSERELSCDELVTTYVLKPETYARSLLSAADSLLQPAPTAVMLSIFDGHILEKRIMELKRSKSLRSQRAGRIITASMIGTLSALTVSLSVFAFELRAPLEPTSSTTISYPVVVEQETVTTGGPQDQPQRRQTLKSEYAQERSEAACLTGREKDLDAIPILIAMLGDETRTEPLNCWRSGRWSPALESFKNPSPGENAAIALASMGRPAFIPLVNQLDNGSPIVRRNAAWAIGELTNMLPGERALAVPQLVALLNDADAWVRMAAARAIGELRDRRAVETLVLRLTDTDWRVRQLSAWALSELKDEVAVMALCNALLSDVRAEVRRGAAEALGEIRSTEALPFLQQAVTDPEASVRAKVGWAIAEIEDSDG